MKKIFFPLIFIFFVSATFAQKKYAYPFQNPSLSIEARVNDLVSRLTLEEKVAQMLNAAPAIDRLGIPAYDWWNECLHGVARTKFHVTSYPQAIGMAATFDVNSMKKMGDFTSEEGRAINNESIRKNDRSRYTGLTYWTPNINIFRDPRWGRGQETYGEDPFLTGSIANAFVTGLQGDDPKYLKAAACAKHYAIHSGPESSRHTFDVNITDHDLWDTYLQAFHELVVNAKVAGVMCAYNAYGGQPCCGNDKLMVNILRNQWKFTGYVTSDCGAIDDFYETHKMFPDAESSAADAVLHGTDVECGNATYKTLVKAVKDGKLTEKDIDASLKRLFTIRFRLGMFDPVSMVKYAQIPITALERQPHKALALEMAKQSIVLLRNENNILPLSKNINHIAVLGPNADNANTQLGNYNGQPSIVTTVLQGIKDKLKNADVFYSRATDFTATTPQDFSKLIDSIKNADVIIYVGGISPRLEGEQMKVDNPGFSGGDRTTIALPSVQTDFMKALKATGKPVVFVMMTGSAVAIPWEEENIPGIIDAWYGGQAAGTAIADVLFGDYSPAGRLPVTFYKSDSDLPPFEDYSMQNRTYRYFKGVPLYPFGFGLSYTKFTYGNLKLSKTKINKNESIAAELTVTNSGEIAGDEVVQLYLTHKNVSAEDPLYSLKGFKRINLKPGASQKVKFIITPGMMKVVNDKGQSVLNSGDIKISVAGSLPSQRSAELGAAKPATAILSVK
ncbi:glycosyl hydrolase [Ginsengibacter hankyongi]|uniref:Glycosyl hydrolase n=1 Tax=Ginsengibacter hankyongi TaxID=2607284 RepID=A0A5J5IL88_9BACT|nr:glycoside hydrolase family 3 C-terminal domain-containing protein [Ginsengibacter hankyongi]KAA9041759.1 glycosyl hydrolase [Ginsengibacter hankyongi]